LFLYAEAFYLLEQPAKIKGPAKPHVEQTEGDRPAAGSIHLIVDLIDKINGLKVAELSAVVSAMTSTSFPQSNLVSSNNP